MTENHRIEELKKRVEKDPTSIAFAQLAEEYRRTGEYQQAVDVCRDGLSRHPGYVSARVTLARALMELDQWAEARQELQAVLSVAPDNLAAIRALADIHQKTGDAEESLSIDVAARVPEPQPVPAVDEPSIDLPLTSEADALPSLDVLDSLSLDLPPLPEMNWDLDAAMELPPLELSGPSEHDGGPDKGRPTTAPTEPGDSAAGELEGWLGAILADRAHTR